MKQPAILLFALPFLLLASCTTGGPGIPRLDHTISYSGTGAGSMIEGTRTVTGRLLLPPPEEDDEPYPIIVTSSGEKIEARWQEWVQAVSVNSATGGTGVLSLQRRKVMRARAFSRIDPLQDYQFELLTRVSTDPGYVSDDILRVSKRGQTLIDSSICYLHKVPMQRQMEEICSADGYPESFFPQQKREFPNDGNFYSGCSQRSDPTWKCPRCSEDYDTWTKKHGLK